MCALWNQMTVPVVVFEAILPPVDRQDKSVDETVWSNSTLLSLNSEYVC